MKKLTNIEFNKGLSNLIDDLITKEITEGYICLTAKNKFVHKNEVIENNFIMNKEYNFDCYLDDNHESFIDSLEGDDIDIHYELTDDEEKQCHQQHIDLIPWYYENTFIDFDYDLYLESIIQLKKSKKDRFIERISENDFIISSNGGHEIDDYGHEFKIVFIENLESGESIKDSINYSFQEIDTDYKDMWERYPASSKTIVHKLIKKTIKNIKNT